MSIWSPLVAKNNNNTHEIMLLRCLSMMQLSFWIGFEFEFDFDFYNLFKYILSFNDYVISNNFKSKSDNHLLNIFTYNNKY